MIVSGTFGCPGEDVYTIEAVLYVERERERERDHPLHYFYRL